MTRAWGFLAGAGLLAATLAASSFLVYALTVLAPGDPALALFRARNGDSAPAIAEQIEAIRREAGFDRPIVVQYLGWLGRAVRGDFGDSFTRRAPVLPLLLERLPITLVLTLGSLLLALALALPSGLLAGTRRWLTGPMLAVTQLGMSLPDYFLAIVLMLVFAVGLGILPAGGVGGPAALVLPLLTLAWRPWATMTRLLMAGLDEAHRADWLRTGRAKGLGGRALLVRHALPHALLPVVAVLGASASGALSGALVAEAIFAIPGAGRLLFEAVAERDIPTVQACLLVQVSLAIGANALAEAAARRLDPVARTAA